MRIHIHIHEAFDTDLAPEGVIAALTDFSEDRPKVWPTLDPDKYEVRELGETSALVREGSRRPNVWSLERYDWSAPGRVRWTVEESSAFARGSFAEALVLPDGTGGSNVEMDAQRVSATLAGALILIALSLLCRRFVLTTYKQVFDELALAEKPSARPSATPTATGVRSAR